VGPAQMSLSTERPMLIHGLCPRTDGQAVCFLWHFPWGCPRWALPTAVPCGARTFLHPQMRTAAARPPRKHYTRYPSRGQDESSYLPEGRRGIPEIRAFSAFFLNRTARAFVKGAGGTRVFAAKRPLWEALVGLFRPVGDTSGHSRRHMRKVLNYNGLASAGRRNSGTFGAGKASKTVKQAGLLPKNFKKIRQVDLTPGKSWGKLNCLRA